jgi:hypothetical protein
MLACLCAVGPLLCHWRAHQSGSDVDDFDAVWRELQWRLRVRLRSPPFAAPWAAFPGPRDLLMCRGDIDDVAADAGVPPFMDELTAAEEGP